MSKKAFFNLCLLLSVLLTLLFLLPFLFKQSIFLQHEFNQQLSTYLHQIEQAPSTAGTGLIMLSFAYGVLHALGPGHGKFIIASYLSTHESKLLSSMRLTFLSSLMQGVVAIIATSILLVGLQLSSSYFKLGQTWLERGAFCVILFLGLQWLYQSLKKLIYKRDSLTFYKFQYQEVPSKISIRPLLKSRENLCSCGHLHLPSSQQLEQQGLKAQILVVFSIGMRPCSGAIFILFLAYMLNLYLWGILATLAMAVGTGLCLSTFALLVLYARKSAINLSQWYLSPHKSDRLHIYSKLIAGLILIFFALTLLYGTTIPSTGGALLFKQ